MTRIFLLNAALCACVAHARVVSPLCSKPKTPRVPPAAMMVIPGDSAAEALLIDGSLNFIGLYSGVITLRILLSWFPQAQGVSLLQPIFTVSDVYLNLFRGVIPPIAGLDISPIAAFFTLNLLSNSVLTLGATPGSHGLGKSQPKWIQGLGDRARRLSLNRFLVAQ